MQIGTAFKILIISIKTGVLLYVVMGNFFSAGVLRTEWEIQTGRQFKHFCSDFKL